MAKHLQVPSASQWTDKAATVAADFLLIADSAAANAPKRTPVSGLSGIPAAGIVNTPSGNLAATDVQAALNELQAEIDSVSTISGQYLGSAATFAALPTGPDASNGDFAILTTVDGVNARGIYVYDGNDYSFATEIGAAIAAQVAATAGAAGVGGLTANPAAGQQAHLWTGGSTWVDPLAAIPAMSAATALLGGTTGLVPAPAAGDESAFLTGAGTWAAATAANLQATTDVGNTTSNDMEFTTSTVGQILRTPDGRRFRLTIGNDEALITTLVV